MTSNNVHMLVLMHGMWGNPGHLAEMTRIYQELRGAEDSERGPDGEQLHLVVPETNKESATYDGIDWGGERVAEEIMAETKRLNAEGKKVTRFSITGYSLGGLISRYVIGILSQKDFFQNITPVNFTTVATPHLGQLLYPTFRSKLFAYFGPKMLSRTGEQLYILDDWASSRRPLLDILADPGRIFFKTLSTFSRIRFYANAVNDITVPYMTAAAEAADPFQDHSFNGIKIELDETYSPIVSSYTVPDVPLPPPPKPRVLSAKWFKGLAPRLPLPPALQYRFPGNILVMLLLPVLVPTFLGLVMFKLSSESRDSRSRVQLLEKDESYTQRLIHVIGQLEKQIEDAAVEYMDDPGDSPESSQTLLGAAPNGLPAFPQTAEASQPDVSPVLTPLQLKIVQSLNKLPNLKKERVFINPVLNSHAVIIARDVKKFKHHETGQAVLHHVADHFVI